VVLVDYSAPSFCWTIFGVISRTVTWPVSRGSAPRQRNVTYVLAGEVEHNDSMGNREGGSGDVQWMTAGSGIIHQEKRRRLN
jgi:hypothetical protein